MPASDEPRTNASPDAVEPASPEAMQRLQAAVGAEYELGALLGRGGFAEVYLAWDRRLRREVAIKTIRPELAGAAEYGERFRREAEAIGRLRHPHIVPVYSVGHSATTPWFIMPRIRGESLAGALEREPHWAFAEVVRILREAAGALAEAHRNGIVHRDIKPENIMLDGPERRVVVMDFGIAKSVDRATSEGGLTQTGMLLGTPHYMSPEQALGERHADPLSDQYSLAMVGYRLLTGRLPFESDSLRGLLHQQAAATAMPLRDRRPDVPLALARIIERALEKEPEKRFANMDEFADALRRVASEIAGEFRVGRREVPLAERWSTVRQQVMDMPRAWPVAAAIGLVTFIVTYPLAEPAAPRRAAGQRSEAVFVAQEWMRQRVGDVGMPYRHELIEDRRLYEFAQRSLSPETLAVRLGRDITPWTWDVDFTPASATESWWVYVAPGRRIYRTDHILLREAEAPGSDSTIDVSDSVVREIQRKELEARGWRAEDLQLDRRNAIANEGYVRRTATWTVPSRDIAGSTDTARLRVSMSTVGTDVRGFSEYYQLSENVRYGFSQSTRSLLQSLFVLLMISLFFAAGSLAARRADRDTLQWRQGAVVGAAVLLLMLFSYSLPLALKSAISSFPSESTGFARVMSAVFGTASEDLGLAALVALGFVAAESLLYEKRPDLSAGVGDLTRGRLVIPELVPAAAYGYCVASIALGATFAAGAIMHRWLGVPLPGRLYLGWSFEIGMPVLAVAYQAPLAIWIAVTSLLLLALASQLRFAWSAAVASVLTGVAFGAFWIGAALPGAGEPEPRQVVHAVMIAALCWLVHRRGVLAGFIAGFVVLGAPVAADLVWAGGDAFWLAGILGFVLLAVPGIGAVVAYRRRPRLAR